MTGVLSGKTVVSTTAGNSFTVILTSDGRVFTIGYNDQGQLGDGTTNASVYPVAVSVSGVLAGKKITSIDTGSSFVIAFAGNATVTPTTTATAPATTSTPATGTPTPTPSVTKFSDASKSSYGVLAVLCLLLALLQ